MGNAYQNASLIVTPNAYKASKIYALKPTDGSGDLSFTRAGSKMVRNSAGLWETIGTNIPPLSYPVGGGCPSWLFEAEATNKCTRSVNFSAWSNYLITRTANFGPSIFRDYLSTKLTFTTSSYMFVTPVTYSSSDTSVLYYKNIDFSGVEAFVFLAGGFSSCYVVVTPSTNTINAVNCTATISLAENGFYKVEMKSTIANTNIQIISDVNKSIEVCYCGIETGSTATSPIITEGSSMTRFADVPTTKNISLGVDEGSFYFQLKERPSAQPDYNGISENSAINGSGKNILCYDDGIHHNLGGGFNALTTIANNDKVCIFWNSTTLWVSKNGATAATFNKTGITFNPLFWNQCRTGVNIVGTILYHDAIFYTACLSITEANNLTA